VRLTVDVRRRAGAIAVGMVAGLEHARVIDTLDGNLGSVEQAVDARWKKAVRSKRRASCSSDPAPPPAASRNRCFAP
jgi:hypothetical protein